MFEDSVKEEKVKFPQEGKVGFLLFEFKKVRDSWKSLVKLHSQKIVFSIKVHSFFLSICINLMYK